MADDRQLRDELEKTQSEVLRLKKALATPATSLHADVRARIESLRKARAQQEAKLQEVEAEVAKHEEQLREVMRENEAKQGELDGLLTSERGLVDSAVRSLDPGPRRGAGCLTVLAVIAVLAALGAGT